MKIPEDILEFPNDGLAQRARNMAEELTLEYGIYITVEITTKPADPNKFGKKIAEFGPIVSEIQFKIMDHRFKNLHDLKKALDNKAFL